MSLRYIIDGNNCLHHPDFSYPRNTPDARLALATFILKYRLTGSRRNKTLLVFDGYPPASHKSSATAGNIEIIFSRKESADQTIKRLLEKAAGHKTIVVVSDDKEIRVFTRLIGARPLSVKDFIRRKDKLVPAQTADLKHKLSYTQMHEINQELRRIWLRDA